MSDLFLPDGLTRTDGTLYVESVPLTQVAQQFDTPCYVYSAAAIRNAYREFVEAFAGLDPLICYAVKANGNLSILRLLSQLGSGFDIVSGGELSRVLVAGGDAGKVVFSGVGKSAAEMAQALQAGVHCFNVESAAELHRLSQVASRLGLRAPVSLRVNPDVDAGTHPYIATGLKESKFGVAYADAFALYEEAARLPGLDVTGIDCHIGSQITDLAPFIAALEKTLDLARRLRTSGIPLRHLDLGGGVGIRYRDETPIVLADYARAIAERLQGSGLRLLLEPGRRIIGNAGLLLTRVEYLKTSSDHRFAIVDAAMNDLIRPSLYEAWHEIIPVIERPEASAPLDVVGPVCETGDILARGRHLSVSAGDLLAILSAGAYGASMGSNYNARPRPPEILVDGHTAHLIRRRESVEDLYRNEWPLA
ncbi:MAG: diaminopimelate decarboxylase [Betaproteobacteria bacterium]|nr:diaminopimelate decarboxylase [Betaproteobacteria bacterium]MDE2621750.1 diaminopimelate decarboxylase [Betaproteobacteria bacterium]